MHRSDDVQFADAYLVDEASAIGGFRELIFYEFICHFTLSASRLYLMTGNLMHTKK